MPPALVLHNADVHMMDGSAPPASAVLIRDGHIVAVGSDGAVRAAAGGRCDDLDCKGDLVLPAFVDAHLHLLSYAASLVSVDCSPTTVHDIAALQAAIAARARTTPPDRWIRAVGYRQGALRERRHPTRWELDAAAPDHPVRLIHGSGHGSVLNSRALALAGISGATAEPPGGVIGRRLEDGEPDGLLLEMEELIEARVPRAPLEDTQQAVAEASRRLLAAGITSVHDLGAHNDAATLALFERLHADGCLRVELVPAIGVEAFLAGGIRGWTGMVKIVLSELGDLLRPDLNTLSDWIGKVQESGARAAVHAVGAAAVQRAIDAFERVLGPAPARGHGHRIEHAAICPPELAVRIARLGLIAVSNPGFIAESGDRYLHEVPAADQPYLHNPATLIDAGACVAAGSDAPVASPDPVRSIRAAVQRRSRSGSRIPGARLQLEQALRLHTVNAALAGRQRDRGRLVPGAAADLVRLPRRLLETDERTNAAGQVRTMQAGVWIGG